MKTSLRLAAFVAVAGLLAGCGNDPKSPRIRSFAASDTSIPEGGEEVTFTWDVKNATSVELLPFPGLVTGSSATVTVTEPTTFTLVAKRKSRKAQESLDIAVGEAFDVAGHVVYSEDGAIYPVPGVTVAIGDRVVLTDETGGFAFPDVVAPYDLILLETPIAFGGLSFVTIFHAVTRPDPTVESYLLLPANSLPLHTGHIAGTVSGGVGFPEPNGDTFFVTTLEGLYTTFIPLGAAVYDFPYDFRTVDPTVATVSNVLQVDFTTGQYAHARVSGTLVDGATLTLNPALVDVPEGAFTLQGSNDWGGTQNAQGFFGLEEFGQKSGAAFSLPIAQNTTTGLFTVSYPDIPALYLELELGAYDSIGYSSINYSSPVGDGLVATIPPPTRIISPADGAIVGAGTPFRVVRPDGQISVFQFSTSPFFGGAPDYNAFVTLYTDETTIEFPDLTALGLPIPTGMAFGWYVYSYGPWADLDEALGQPGGHQDPPGGIRYSGGPLAGQGFITEGDDDDDGVGITAVRWEAVPET